MSPISLAPPRPARHVVLPDKAGRLATARVQGLDSPSDWAKLVGRVVGQAIAVVGWSHKEAAARLGVDPAELGKWISGERRPQLDRILAVADLREPLAIALAHVVAGASIETRIIFRKRVSA